jgi:hypothetical protein
MKAFIHEKYGAPERVLASCLGDTAAGAGVVRWPAGSG